MKRSLQLYVQSSIGALALAGCQAQQTRVPIQVPRQPELVSQTAEAEANVRSTIVGGAVQAPGAQRDAAQVPPERGDISLNLPSADVRVAAKAVLGDILGAQYTIAEGTSGEVSVVTPGPVSRSALLGLFEKALQTSGLALSSAPDGYLIQPISAAQASGPLAPNSFGYGTEIVGLQFINAEELRKLLDSVLPKVVIATDAATNSITIAGTTGQRKSARDLAMQFDVNWLRNMSFALYVPQRTDSRLIVPELEKLINAADAPTRGLVRIISMERLNGILAVSAQRQYLQDVQRWVEILDREGESNEARLFVYRVQNGRARDLARTLNAAFGGAQVSESDRANDVDVVASNGANEQPSTNNRAPRSVPAAPTGQANDGASPVAPIAGQGRISADEVNNAVIVYGTPRQYAVVEDAMRKLDVLPLQVLIEAAITEVSLTDELRFGVQWNFQEGNANFALTEGEGSTAPTRINPGFSFFFSPNNNIIATLNALEQRTNVKVVSAPKLLVLNNQTAALQVGDQVPIITQSATGVQNADSPIVNSVEYRDTGVILRVTPRVNEGGLVLLDISQEVSDVTTNRASNINSPTIQTRRVSTSVAVKDQQVLALGGLFRDAQSFGKNGLPILSRIPILGSLLFGNRNDVQRRTELIIILKATVVRTADDGRAITEELRAKLRTLEPFRTQGRIP